MTQRRFVRAKRPRRGFTLIEMIIAIVVMSVGILGLAGTASYVATQMGGGKAQTVAAAMATKVADSLAARRCSAIVSGSQTKNGATVTWTVADSSRTRWVTESVQYRLKRGPMRTFNYTTVIQCPES